MIITTDTLYEIFELSNKRKENDYPIFVDSTKDALQTATNDIQTHIITQLYTTQTIQPITFTVMIPLFSRELKENNYKLGRNMVKNIIASIKHTFPDVTVEVDKSMWHRFTVL